MVRFSRVALVAPLPMCPPVRSCLTCHETRWGPFAEISIETRWDQGVTTKSAGICKHEVNEVVISVEESIKKGLRDLDALLRDAKMATVTGLLKTMIN